jgi:hypothetical protein
MLVSGVLGLVVGASAEGVGLVVFSWLMTELKVVLLKLHLPISGVGFNLVWFTPVDKVLVISPNDDRLIRWSSME